MNFVLDFGNDRFVMMSREIGYGFFLNSDEGVGYEKKPRPDLAVNSWFCKKMIYEFTLNPDPLKALTYVLPNGWALQPDRHFFTDDGSIPPFLQWRIQKDDPRFFLGFFLHDSWFQNGGIYLRESLDVAAPYVFCKTPAATANRFLACVGLGNGAPANTAALVYTGTQLGASLHLVKYGKGEPVERTP